MNNEFYVLLLNVIVTVQECDATAA